MDSLNKLREYAAYNCRVKGWKDDLKSLADGIEAEVESEYMKLPVDADGVPIHVGDLLKYQCEEMPKLHAQGVYVYKDGRKCVMNERLGIWLPEQCRHVKPRTLEGILEQLVECASFPGESLDRGDIEGFAAEIRELLEVGE